MLKKDNFFHNFFANSKSYYKNKIKTKKAFNSLLIDLDNFEIPMLTSHEKEYDFDFLTSKVKKFSKYKNIIIVGMGGSILGAKSIYSFFQKKIKKKVFFFDNLDPNLNLKYKQIKNLKNSCYIIISKSGNTLETITNLNLIYSKSLFKDKLIIITETTDNKLMAIANRYNAEIIEHREFIGGRYSVLSEAGMFPAALMGLNPIKFKNLKKIIKNKNFILTLLENVSSIYTLNECGINNSVIISYDSDLNNLGYWYQQLVAESLGKKGKGINPTVSFGPKDHHSLFQLYLDGPRDKFFTFFNFSQEKNISRKDLRFVINAQYNATKNIFKLKKMPFRQINFKRKNEEELGEAFSFFVLETILLARLMNLNPFDQPAVEQVKIETKKFLR